MCTNGERMEVGDGMFGHSSPPLDFATMIPPDFLPALGQLFLYITLHDVYIYTTYYSSNCSDVLCLFPLKFRDGNVRLSLQKSSFDIGTME